MSDMPVFSQKTRLLIPSVAIAYTSMYEQNGVGHAEITTGPRMIQVKDIPSDLLEMICVLVGEYELKRREFDPDTKIEYFKNLGDR